MSVSVKHVAEFSQPVLFDRLGASNKPEAVGHNYSLLGNSQAEPHNPYLTMRLEKSRVSHSGVLHPYK